MSGKRESFTLDALLKGQESDQNKENPDPESRNISAELNSQNENELKVINNTNKPVTDFWETISKVKSLKLEAKTKMDIGAETNKKIMILSKTVGVSGYALVDVIINEFLEKNRKDIEKTMKQFLK